jgi:hypothetical protein
VGSPSGHGFFFDATMSPSINQNDKMAHAVPEFSREEFNAAGKVLIAPPDNSSGRQLGRALDVINNWRASHSYPLNLLHLTLRNRAKKISATALTAQRTKRLESIHAKLSRQPTMHLTQMQDIGGCRCVLPTIEAVRNLAALYENLDSDYSHKRAGGKDYLINPKSDGYRGIHLIYKYAATGDDKKCYDDLKIEIQIRSLLQHSWATAVEAAGTFTKQALKSNQGTKDWLRFFSLVSSSFAMTERSAGVPGTPSSSKVLVEEIKYLCKELKVIQLLQSYNATLQQVGSQKDKKYYLIHLMPDAMKVQVMGFGANESQMANHYYTRLESEVGADSADQVVLVSVDSVSALKRAYPNYFLDTSRFVKSVQKIIS